MASRSILVAILLALTLGHGTESQASGLIAHWPFDSGVTDVVGGHGGSAQDDVSINTVDFAPVAGNTGSLEIGPMKGYVEVLNATDFSYSGPIVEFTMGFWFKVISGGHVFGKRSSCVGNQNINYQLYTVPNPATGGYRIEVRTGNAVNAGFANSAIDPSRFVHIAISHDAAGNFKYYEDGIVRVSDGPVSMDQANSGSLRIGTVGGCGGIVGLIDEFVAYDRALSDEEVLDLATPADCGDGTIWDEETCDDGNQLDGDGCSSTCSLECGFACSGDPSICTPTPLVQDPASGNFYEFVPDFAVSWTEANDRAHARTCLGAPGFLATLTSASEDAFMTNLGVPPVDPPAETGGAWIGASDEAVEGDWRWVTGPEGDEDGGAGRLFLLANSPIGEHTNFGPGEPNDGCDDPGGEDYGTWRAPPDNWNDLTSVGLCAGTGERVYGYIVEYPPRCSDGVDNDGDGLIDHPDDPGCFDGLGTTENPACQDGQNNDSDLVIDFDGGQSIHGACIPGPGGCPMGVSDLDDDGVADPDPTCVGRPWFRNEGNPKNCGRGAFFPIALASAYALFRSRRGRC